MSVTAPLAVTVDEAAKTLTFGGPLGLRESAAVAVTPATPVTGATLITITRLGTVLAEAELTDGAGTLDLNTAEAIAVFDGLPARHVLTADAHLWHSAEDRLLGTGVVRIVNNPASAGSALRVAAAGRLNMALATALDAGTAVKRDSSGNAAACAASDAHLLLGILAESGNPADSCPVVTAGIVTVADWGLTPGACYYLSTGTTGALTSAAPAGYNVRPVGIAIDAATLALIPQPTVQTIADSADPHTIAWDPTARRFVAQAAAAASSGAGDAGLIPCLGADGKLDSTLMPDMTDAAIAAHAALFADIDELTLNTSSIDKLTVKLNQILAILKGA
jgi:hypothetical protein